MRRRAVFLVAVVWVCSASDCVDDMTKPDSGDTASPPTPTTPTPTTTMDFTITVDWTDDGYVPTDTDGDGQPDEGCGDSVTIDIFDPMGFTEWSFGMVDSISGDPWFGEDCYLGQYPYNLCHSFTGTSLTLDQVTSCQVSDVTAGATTLFDSSRDPFTTYYLVDSSGACFIWGAEPAYYSPLFCVQM